VAEIVDDEFGAIPVRRSAKATNIRLRVAPDGKLRASLPLYAPLFLVKKLIRSSRDELRQLLSDHQSDIIFTDGMQIGKSHSLIVRETASQTISASRHGQQIIVHLPKDASLNGSEATMEIRQVVQQALRTEAKSYLPKRLKFLAQKGDFHYKNSLMQVGDGEVAAAAEPLVLI
jgi:predicted metal-dependent hydrolase